MSAYPPAAICSCITHHISIHLSPSKVCYTWAQWNQRSQHNIVSKPTLWLSGHIFIYEPATVKLQHIDCAARQPFHLQPTVCWPNHCHPLISFTSLLVGSFPALDTRHNQPVSICSSYLINKMPPAQTICQLATTSCRPTHSYRTPATNYTNSKMFPIINILKGYDCIMSADNMNVRPQTT